MTMTLSQQIITIAAVALATMLTRFLPFILFPAGKKTPAFVSYIGKVLPAAVFGLLVVYCLKGVTPFSGNHGLPEFIAVAAVVFIHKWKHNTFFSILLGTACYMVLIRLCV